jgi:hypothetical protein
MEKHLKTHIESNNTIREVAAYYKEHGLLGTRVSIAIVDNSRGKGKAVEMSLEDLPALRYDDFEEKAYEELRKARAEGKISAAVYRGFGGSEDGAADDASVGTGDHRKSEPVADGENGGVTPSDGEGRA